MKIPFKYTIRNFGTRRLTTVITISGIALVVFVFAAVLMMAYGVKKTLVSTGSPDNVKITRKAANGEISSIIDGDTQGIIKSLPYISKKPDGTPIISDEPVVIINLEKSNGSGVSNITVRGVSPTVNELRPQMKIIDGRMFRFGVRELIVGKSIASQFSGAQIGSSVKFAGDNWKIVGIFSTDGSGFDSEMWGDEVQLLSAFNRGSTVSSVTLRLDNIRHYDSFINAFSKDRRLQQFEAKPEQRYFEEQSEIMSAFIKYLGLFVTIIFSIGATIGAMITMYAAVANRTVEVGTLRALGFSRRSILIAFLTESLFIALTGGIIGIVLASLLQFISISTLNFNSFSELAFSFALSPDIVLWTLFFALIMGFIGGFLPS
ncbi:MAG TPA: ABC transporter permease, partial [Ignavibacteriaceae bacterium]|nr:ABC transporter permease [Ignavibacteriaceae bacterium]